MEEKFESYAKLEKLAWLEECANRTIAGLSSLHQKAIHDAVKPFKARKCQQTAFWIEVSPGVEAGSYAGERQGFRAHWSKMLAGKTTTFADLIRLDRERWRGIVRNSTLIQKDLGAMPSKTELTRRFASARRKAVPEDGLGGELFAAQPHRLARLFHPLLSKAVTSFLLPLQIRGGQIHEIYKGKGLQKLASNYRDVTIASEFAKSFGSLLRPRMLPIVEKIAGTSQFGSGLNTGATDVAHVLVRAYTDVAQLLKLSLGLLFVDLSTAFASVVRALALPTDVTDSDWRAKLLMTGFTEEEADEVIQEVHACDEWSDAGGSAHVQALITQLHIGTWAATEGLAGVLHFQSGTLAGTPAADLVFISAFARVLKQTRRNLCDAGLLWRVDTSGAEAYFGDNRLAGNEL